ncbi:unnamed protein product, partial [marine sediment metagenome]
MFTIQLIKSIGPNGELRFIKNTQITLPINASQGNKTHIPTISSG